ncbi:MAG: hypothetical protein Fur0023_10740 [Bacteroidia bacterium]
MKRKYQPGYYIELITNNKKLQNNCDYKTTANVRLNNRQDNYGQNTDCGITATLLPIMLETNIHNLKKEIHLKENTYRSKIKNKNTSFHKSKKEYFQKACSKNNYPEEQKSPKTILKGMIIFDLINLGLFILLYSLLYAYIFDIYNTIAGGFFFGCLFVPISILSLSIIIKHFINFIQIFKHDESSSKQKYTAGFLLLLSILFHPLFILIFMNINLFFLL